MNPLPQAVHDLPLRKLAAGETLIEEGGAAGRMYFLARGSVEVLKGGMRVSKISEPGAVFGEMSILMGSPPSATVRALSESEFRVAESPAELLKSAPELSLYIAEILARRLDMLTRYLVDVKSQFKDRADHLGMLDEMLDALLNKHPRKIERRPVEEP